MRFNRNINQRHNSVDHNWHYNCVDTRNHDDIANNDNADNDTLVDYHGQYSFVNGIYGFNRNNNNVNVYKCDDWYNDADHNAAKNDDETSVSSRGRKN
jgi:hypothetical protein